MFQTIYQILTSTSSPIKLVTRCINVSFKYIPSAPDTGAFTPFPPEDEALARGALEKKL